MLQFLEKIRSRLGAFWFSVLFLLSVITVIAWFIYGFDISTNAQGVRRGIAQQFENEATVNFFFRINDEFTFNIYSDRPEGEMDIGMGTYRKNAFPYCYVCGYFTSNSEDTRGMVTPYKVGNLVYSIEPLERAYMGLEAQVYPTYNIETQLFSSVKSLDEIAPDAASPVHKVTREYIQNNYNEISFESSDDEDCWIVFSALSICYIILLIWGTLAILIRRP